MLGLASPRAHVERPSLDSRKIKETIYRNSSIYSESSPILADLHNLSRSMGRCGLMVGSGVPLPLLHPHTIIDPVETA